MEKLVSARKVWQKRCSSIVFRRKNKKNTVEKLEKRTTKNKEMGGRKGIEVRRKVQ